MSKARFVWQPGDIVITKAEDLRAAYDPDQPRDEQGQWVSFYHGTSSGLLPSIKSGGLQISKGRIANITQGDRKPSIFVTNDADAAVRYAYYNTGDNEKPVVIEIRVPVSKSSLFLPDEVDRPGTFRVESDIPADWIGEVLSVDGLRVKRSIRQLQAAHPVITAADTQIAPLSVNVRYAFSRAKKALRAGLGLDRALRDMEAALGTTLPRALARAARKGGEAAVGELRTAEWREEDHPRDEKGRWTDTGTSITARVFHGSPAEFDQFSLAHIGKTTDPGYLGRGLYFSTDTKVSGAYPIEYETEVTLENPLRLKSPENDWRFDKQQIIRESLGLPKEANVDKVTLELIKRGHDSVVFDYSPSGYKHREVMTFREKNIKIISRRRTGRSDAGTKLSVKNLEEFLELRVAYDPDQPRDEQGRWTDGVSLRESGRQDRLTASFYEGGEEVGYVDILTDLGKDIAQTEGLEIFKEFRGRGAATRAYEALAKELPKRGFTKLVSSDMQQEGGRAVWEKLKKSHPEIGIEGERYAWKLAEEFRTAKRATPKAKLNIRFDAERKEAQAWAKQHAAELISDISETSRKKIRNIVAEFGNLNDAIDRIEELVFDVDRAETIARTESMRAAHEGQKQLWRQAEEEGLLTRPKRTWITTPDDKLCPICEGLDGQEATLEGEYEAGIEGPPAHPNCRCTEGLA